VNKDGNSFIVSEFAARMISEMCETSFIVHASKTHLALNPSFDGWILEADFLLHIRLAEKTEGISLYEEIDISKQVKWKVGVRNHFSLPNTIQYAEYAVDNWFIPLKWNQGCYDAVQILPGDGFRFIQVTRSLTHSLKLRYIVEFLNRFKELNIYVKFVEICFVLPQEEKYREFNPKIAEGSFGDYKDKLSKCGKQDYFRFGFIRS
jgi:hypothetical protein